MAPSCSFVPRLLHVVVAGAVVLLPGAIAADEANPVSAGPRRLDDNSYFGWAAPPTAQPTAAPQGRDFTPGLVLFVVGLFMYLGLYGFLRSRFRDGTYERHLLDRSLWCWEDLYTGRACILYTIFFSPVLLVWHAIRIYVPYCLVVYLYRIFWVLFGPCFKLYTDPEFPPDDRSVGQVGGDTANEAAGHSTAKVIWVRAMDFARPNVLQRPNHPVANRTDMCLFQGKIEAQDILQGQLGDCWLLAAMATLAEREGLINRLFLTREIDPRGKYSIQLYDVHEARWKVFVIDDYIPCKADPSAPDGVARGRSVGSGHISLPQALYAKPNGPEIWCMLLEKAMAKLCGNYHTIEGGITEWGIVAMTGGTAWRYELQANGLWQRMDLVATEGKDPNDKRSVGFRMTEERHEAEDFFKLLRHYHRCGAVLCCGGVKNEGKAYGLVMGHAFSLLQVVSVRQAMTSEKYFRMVQVRNPWGQGEWKGSWSDKSPEWDHFPYVRKKLGFEGGEDGCFWMQWEDFIRYWGYVGCVDCNRDILTLRSPLYVEKQMCGPMKAFCKGCAQYWCLCYGPQHYFISHEASVETVDDSVIHRSCGVDPTGAYCRVCEHDPVHIDEGNVVHSDSYARERPMLPSRQ